MISTHILDTHLGLPAAGVSVQLDKQDDESWNKVDAGVTNVDGRIVFDCPSVEGVYRLSFKIEDYYEKNEQEFFFLSVPVTFKVVDTNRKYHVPLLLNPFGYTTYRGS
jgi:5-hydroxyisourate hydrolase